MPRSKVSEQEKVLDYFQEAPLGEVVLVYGFLKGVVRRRLEKEVSPQDRAQASKSHKKKAPGASSSLVPPGVSPTEEQKAALQGEE